MNIMIRHTLYIIIFTIFAATVCFGASGDMVSSEETEVALNTLYTLNTIDADEALLFELINSARKDPLGMATSLGMDPDKILSDFPEYEDILINGLPELEFDDRLYQTSSDHTSDMLEQNYYSYESLDGQTLDQRMNDAGYVASVSGETLGLLFFNNFINSNQAVFQVFENMFKDELDPEWTGQRNILDQDVNDIGVSISGGIFQFNERFSGNVYMVTCDFGAAVETYELELVQLVNQARANPRAVVRYYGMYVGEVLDAFPDFEDVFKQGLPPLSLNQCLYSAAEDAVLEMFESENFENTFTPEDSTLEMRFRDHGYESLWTAETFITLNYSDDSVSPQIVSKIFEQLFSRAFRTGSMRDMNMFSDTAKDIGVRSVVRSFAEKEFVCGDFVHMTALDYGVSDELVSNSALVGLVYDDLNGNGLFDAGEGIPDATIKIKEAGVAGAASLAISTNPAGGFSIDLAASRYRVSVEYDSSTMEQWVDVSEENAWLPIVFKGLEAEGQNI